MENYLLLIVSDILLAFNFSISKVYQKWRGVSIKAGFFSSAITGIFTAVIFFVINGFDFEFSWYSMIMATVQTVLVTTYTVISYRILKLGTMALYTLFLMSGGMIIPYIWGLLFLNEEFSWLRTAALLLIVIAIILSNPSGKKNDKKMIYMCLAVFFINGFVSVVSKLHQVEKIYPTVDTSGFVILGGLTKFIIAGIFCLALKNKAENKEYVEDEKGILPILGILALSSAISGVSSLLQLRGASSLPATVVYPVITGGSIVFSSIAGMLLFKEKVTKRLVASIAICFAATLMFL